MEFDEYLVRPKTSIIDTMKKIDNNSKRIVFVVDSDEQLVGSISDGNIRRYLLEKHSIDVGFAEDVMNSAVSFLYTDEIEKAEELMRTRKIFAVPIVDSKRKIVSIVFSDEHEYCLREKVSSPVVIMAGGKGSRLEPYTKILPKPLIPIDDRTITEHIMSRFGKFGCLDFHIIVNYKKELIKAYFQETESQYKINFYDEKEFRGTAGGLKLLEGKITETFFLSNCDILIEENYANILKYHIEHKNIITLVGAIKKMVIPYGTIEKDSQGNIVKLNEKPEMNFLTNTGFYVVEPRFLEYVPTSGVVHITDIIQKCIDLGEPVGVFPIRNEAWLDMGQLGELEKMKMKLK